MSWPIKKCFKSHKYYCSRFILIIYIIHYHVVPYNFFALLYFNRLKYLLALKAPVICVSSRLKSFHLMSEDICLLIFLPIDNIFRVHVTYFVSRDNSFTSSLRKDWILINCTYDCRRTLIASVLLQTTMASMEKTMIQEYSDMKCLFNFWQKVS